MDEKRPSVTFEIVGDSLRVVADWEKDADLDTLAAMLSQLHCGELADFTSRAITLAGDLLDDRDNAAGVNNVVATAVARAKGVRPDGPVVDPELAIRLLMKHG